MQTEAMRDRMFTMRLSDEEGARADRIAGHYGVNLANLIRMLLKREDDALGAFAASPVGFGAEPVSVLLSLSSGPMSPRSVEADVLRRFGDAARAERVLGLLGELHSSGCVRWEGSNLAITPQGERVLATNPTVHATRLAHASPAGVHVDSKPEPKGKPKKITKK